MDDGAMGALMVLTGLVGGIIMMFLCRHVAVQKGHDPGNATVAGCLFGIFALLYYLMVGKSERKRKQEYLQQRQWESEFRQDQHNSQSQYP